MRKKSHELAVRVAVMLKNRFDLTISSGTTY